jgi:hypothetical protein
MANCDDKGRNEARQCKEYRDDGYNECSSYEDQGYNSCDNWEQDCCDWWPCSWGCELISWICTAWVWISNIVCVAWYWVSNVVCVAWVVVVYMICTVVEVAVTVLSAIITALESVVGWFLDVLAWFVDLILSIPIIGRLIKEIWNAILTIWWAIVSAVDSVLYLIGIRPEKTLRVCTILFCDGQGNPEGVAKTKNVVDQLQKAIDVFRQAHVRLVPSRPFTFRSGFGGREQADDSWVTPYCSQGGTSSDLLDMDCDALLRDLGAVGSQLQFVLDTNCSFGNYRRLLGYGAPVAVFIIHSVSGGDASGCGGPIWDYVFAEVTPISTFDGGDEVGRTIAHELGHACNLFHIDVSRNLMKVGADADLVKDIELTTWQQILIRTSRHVTYL